MVFVDVLVLCFDVTTTDSCVLYFLCNSFAGRQRPQQCSAAAAVFLAIKQYVKDKSEPFQCG